MPQPASPPGAARPARAVKSFRFQTSLILQESTGLRAATLPELVKLLRTVPEACIYHHTHHFLFQHQFLTPEPANDFAYWTREVLREVELSEWLAEIDTMAYSSLESLRGALVAAIDTYLKQAPAAHLRFASDGEEFFFVKSIRFVLPTAAIARSMDEFADAISQITLHSLYYHIFEARLRLARPTNDFAVWVEEQYGLTALAKDIAALNPYVHTLEELRGILVGLLRRQLRAGGSG